MAPNSTAAHMRDNISEGHPTYPNALNAPMAFSKFAANDNYWNQWTK